MKKMIVMAAVCCALAACGTRSDGVDQEKFGAAIDAQMSLYPDATLQDLYKGFAQAEFGPGHMISDSASVGKYLDYELQDTDRSEVLYEPVGADSSYFRIHLCAVQSGRITRDMLMDAFLKSARKVDSEEIAPWIEKWHGIEKVVKDMDLGLEHFKEDSQMIDSALNSGHYALHHSLIFGKQYNPHYRIVQKDIFYEKLYDHLK